jgi:MoaA/NifB/PqqE/SkfB family radical SAM enzyme
MDRIKRYVNIIPPVTACNLQCDYCYIGINDGLAGEIKKLPYSIDYVAKSLSKERLAEGGKILFSFCGMGETLLPDYVIELAKKLIWNGNYVIIISNATITKRISELCSLNDYIKENICIQVSFHYIELQKRNLLEVFFNNINKLKKSGISFYITIVPVDEMIVDVDRFKKICIENFGALPQVYEARDHRDSKLQRMTNLPLGKHTEIWGSFNSGLFEILQQYINIPQRKFCYAGDWSINIYLEDGNITPCHSGGVVLDNVYNNVDEPLNFAAIGVNCWQPWCYSVHCMMTMGVVPSVTTPSFDELRNRLCHDGTEWLNHKLKQFLKTKLYDSNKEYSEDKKKFINCLMSVEYDNNLYKYNKDDIADILQKNLSRNGIYSVAIFGTEKNGQWLLDILTDINFYIKVKFVVTHEILIDKTQKSIIKTIKQYIKFYIRYLQNRKPILLTLFDKWPKVDAIIVTPFSNFYMYKKILSKKTINKIINITQLVE